MTKFKPIEFKVLVIPDKVEEYSGSIVIPEIVRDKFQVEQDRATIVEIGGNAFEDMKEPVPKIGDKVLLNRHAGYRFFDKEVNPQVEYRVVNDKDITMILGKEESEEENERGA